MVGLVVVSNTFLILIELSSMAIYNVKEEITKHNNLINAYEELQSLHHTRQTNLVC